MNSSSDGRSAFLESGTLAFLRSLEAQSSAPLHRLNPADARSRFLQLQADSHVGKLPATIEDMTIQTGPTGSIELRIVRPPGNSSLLPGVIYFHGGGWVMGDAETHDRLIRELVNITQTTIIFVHYDRSPEARYPIAVEQAYSATEWVAEHGATVRVDSSRLAVAGDGSGGTLATVVTMLAKERQGPKIDFQALFYPATDAQLPGYASYHQYGDGRYWLSAASVAYYWDSYAAADLRQQPTVSPLHASVTQLQGLPPALVITAENDVLRDEGEAYVRKLIEAGVVVTATRYLGTIHGFMVLNALAETPATRAATVQVGAALRHAFAR
ncbi:MAG TPA: alpha/beta hydrolase [Anaerolineae bacterium]|nr:alpha/beta hydrolase [Anaerolineae bacterium]